MNQIRTKNHLQNKRGGLDESSPYKKKNKFDIE